MADTKAITTCVLEALQRNPGCEFDLLVKECSEFTWNQLFYEVDRLSRLGQLYLYPVEEGRYCLRLPKKEEPLQEAESGIATDVLSRSFIPTGTDDLRT